MLGNKRIKRTCSKGLPVVAMLLTTVFLATGFVLFVSFFPLDQADVALLARIATERAFESASSLFDATAPYVIAFGIIAMMAYMLFRIMKP